MNAATPPTERLSGLALRVIEAQQHADELVRKVAAGELDAEGLALAIAPLYGLTLQALARAIVKALRP